MKLKNLFPVFILLLLHRVHCGWLDPPWLPSGNPNTTLVDGDRLYVKEEVSGNIIILVINYDEPLVDVPPILKGYNFSIEFDTEKKLNNLKMLLTPDYEVYSAIFITDYPLTILDKTFNFNVENVDDNAPVARVASSTCLVAEEGEENQKTTCKVTVTDVDGCASLAKPAVFENDQLSALFTLETNVISDPKNCLASSGKDTSAEFFLVVKSPLDYEAITSYPLTISTTDAGGNVGATVTLTVQVDDINDQPPEWQAVVVSYTCEENKEETFHMNAVDGDHKISAEINYSLDVLDSDVTDEEKNYFQINANGDVKISAFDRDKYGRSLYTLQITAFEVKDESKSIETTVIVIVKDINDNSPICSLDAGVLCDSYLPQNIPENEIATFDQKFHVTDPDEATNGTFNVELANTDSFFVFPTQAFQIGDFTIQCSKPLDYETMKRHEFQLIITEVADATHKLTIPIVVNVLDVNDNAPVFEKDSYSVTVQENQKKGLLLNVTANDVDENDLVKYEISSIDFSIENGSIVLLADNYFDYERQKNVLLQINAYDTERHTTITTLNISVTDVNDTPPTATLSSGEVINVQEGTQAGTNITDATIEASDLDESALLSASIDWSSTAAYKDAVKVNTSLVNSWFKVTEIEATKGSSKFQITVDEGIDWQVADTIQLQVQITDKNTAIEANSTSVRMPITIDNINNNKPVLGCDGSFTMREMLEENVRIGVVRVSDPDGTLNPITFSILPDEFVTIDSTQGILSTTGKSVDYEQQQFLVLNITADDTDPEHLVYCMINITVIDINDNTPTLNPDKTVANVLESATEGTLFKIVGTDLDLSEPFSTMTFQMADSDYFAFVDHQDGTAEVVISLQNGVTFDFENQKSYPIVITVTDNPDNFGGEQKLSSQTSLTVNIEDVNDNAPQLQENADSCLFSIAESTQKGAILSSELKVTDADSGQNGEFTVTIANVECDMDTMKICSKDGLFQFSESSNVVTAMSDLTGHYGHYNVTVTATDKGDPPLTGSQNYIFCISDVNDNAPIFQAPYNDNSLTMTIIEDGNRIIQYDQTEIPAVVTVDADWGPNGNVEYRISPTTFRVSPVETEVNTINIALNGQFEQLPEVVEVTIDANDMPLDSTVTKQASSRFTFLPVVLRALEPEFTVADTSLKYTLKENFTDASQQLPKASDRNNVNRPTADIEEIYYYIIDGDEEYFQIDKTTALITVKKALDAAIQASYTLRVQTSNTEDFDKLPAAEGNSVTTITITVEDINDKWPVFDTRLNIFAVTNLDDGKRLASLTAHDEDAGDVVKYSLVDGSLSINLDPPSTSSDNIVSVNENTGDLTVAYPKGLNNGNLTFSVSATDKENHEGFTDVLIYLVPERYLMVFSFNNSESDLSIRQNEVVEILEKYFNHTCVLNGLTRYNYYANMTVYFQDENHAPLDPNAGDIVATRNNLNTMSDLRDELFEKLEIRLIGAGEDRSLEEGDDLEIILIALVSVLGVAVVALAAFHLIKTRRLSTLVKNFTNASAAQTENKIAVLPNTNIHKEKGSNPVWNQNIQSNELDAEHSSDSDDSEFDRMENNPEFEAFYNEVIMKSKEGNSNATQEGDFPKESVIELNY